MLGAVRGVDPETGHHFDDTKRFVDAVGLDDVAAHYGFRRVVAALDQDVGPDGFDQVQRGVFVEEDDQVNESVE